MREYEFPAGSEVKSGGRRVAALCGFSPLKGENHDV